MCGSIPAQFINSSAGGLIYYWNFGDGSPITVGNNVTHPYLVDDNESYTVVLTAESVYGCKDSVQNLFILPLLYYIPNTFTPDGDEFNNDFKPIFSRNEKVESYHFLIYNRWGEIIFESYDPKYGWDGTYHSLMSQDATYEWELIYKDRECDNGKKHIFGHVNLIK